jgi:hypothetical protein
VVYAGEPHAVIPDHIEGDLRSRLAGSYDEYRALLDLRGPSIFGGVNLDDVRIQSIRESRNSGCVKGASRYHHIVGPDPFVTRVNEVSITVCGDPVHLDSCSHGKPEPSRILLEVVRDVVLCREAGRETRVGHTRKAVVPTRREQT